MLQRSPRPGIRRQVFDLTEADMGAFNDMEHRGYRSELPLEIQEQFTRDVERLFPESPSSRLARACGGVNNRTAQKWISGALTPPEDVREYVAAQIAILDAEEYDKKLLAFAEANAGSLDREVVTAQVAGLFEKMSGGYKIRLPKDN